MMKISKYLPLFLLVHITCAKTIVSDILNDIDQNKQYVIYLHGDIIERGDPKPIHPRFGLYDFPAIQQALATKNIVLISKQRKPNTVAKEYAQFVKSQVNNLITKGVKPQDITILGFSKGAAITIMASVALENDKLNYVIMANCGDWYENSEQLNKLKLTGHVLSVYEESDGPGSCQNLANKSKNLLSFKEIITHTGQAHGAFFKPLDAWLKPVLKWITRSKK